MFTSHNDKWSVGSDLLWICCTAWCTRQIEPVELGSYLSQALSVQLAMTQKDNMNTSSTVPGIIVISVLTTNLVSTANGQSQVRVAMTTNFVSKLMRFSAPMLRDAASEKRMLCSSIVRQMRYRRRNIGSEKTRSTGIRAVTE